MKIFVLVVAPIIEIVVAILVADMIGLGWTLLALVTLSLLGIWQIKIQGLAAWRTARQGIENGESPAPTALDGALRLVGAVLLAAPGFVSALVGMVFLVRPARSLASRHTGRWVVTRLGMPFVVVTDDGAAGWRFRSTSEPDVVDVEGWEEPAARTGRPVLTPPDESRY